MGTTKMNAQSIKNQKLHTDDVFPKSEMVSLESLTNLPSRKGLENAVVSGGKIVNIVSKSYGHLPNETFLSEVERKLIEADIKYDINSINRDDRSFAVDYILNDDRFIVKIKDGKDVLRPQLRFINSYDGSCKTTGSFGFYRLVCSNGLMVAKTQIGFSVKHRGANADIIMPAIAPLVEQFMSNEYYELSRKFEVLSERPIGNLEDFVRVMAKDFKLFTFESSEKNPAPSLNARRVIETIQRETAILGEPASLWIGYNALNEVLHNKLKKTFSQQADIDARIFEGVMSMAQ